jgi:hypothetical protein
VKYEDVEPKSSWSRPIFSYPFPKAASKEDSTIDSISKWSPKINLKWPPTISLGSESDKYEASASDHDDSYSSFSHKSHNPHVQLIAVPAPHCHQQESKMESKTDLSLLWPLLLLASLLLPLLVGSFLLPLAFLFIPSLINLIPIPTPAPGGTGRRKRRSIHSSKKLGHPDLQRRIDSLADQVDYGVQKFIKFLYDE